MLRWGLTTVIALGSYAVAYGQDSQNDEPDSEVVTIWHERKKIDPLTALQPIAILSADELDVDEVIVSVWTGGQDKHAPNSKPHIELSDITLVEGLNRTAGIHIQQGSGSETLTSIRSPVLTGGAGAGSFFYGLDGIALRAQGFANINGFLEMPYELSSGVEVAKGPWPVFLGTNAVHGAVNAITRPKDETRFKFTAGENSYLSVQAQIALNDYAHNLLIGFSGTHDGGFRAESGYDNQKLLIRHETQIGAWSVTSVLSAVNLNQETAGFAQGDEAYKDEALAYGNANPEAFRDVKSVLAYTELYRDLGNSDLYIRPFFRSTDMEFRLHFLPGQALERNDHMSVGAQTRLDWDELMLGIDAEITDGHLDEFQGVPTRFSFIQGAHYDYDVTAKSVSLYGNWTPQIFDKLSANLGARLEHVRYDYENRIDNGVFGRFLRLGDQSDDFTLFLPRASLLYKLSDTQSLYVKAARGGRAPQTTDLYRIQINQLANPAKPETLDTIEAGYKGRLDGFEWELSAYTMRKENYFFRDADGFNIADGKTQHSGVELSGAWEVTERLTLSGALALAKHTYDFDRPVGNSSEVISKGNRIDTAPDIQGNMSVSYRPTGNASFTLGWTHMGEYFTNAANTQDYPGHDVFDLSGDVEVANDFTLFGRIANLTDARYADRADFAFGNERYFPGRPRSLFVGIEKRF